MTGVIFGIALYKIFVGGERRVLHLAHIYASIFLVSYKLILIIIL